VVAIVNVGPDFAFWQRAVFVLSDGRARQWRVEIGRSSPDEAQLLGGLVEGERVILHASDRVADGIRVTARSKS
jgi:HlyD family secretion protein